MRLLPVALLLVSSAAAAQSLALKLDDADQIVVGPPDCPRVIRVTYTPTAITACSALTFWITVRATCGDAAVAGDLQLDSVPQAEVNKPTTRTFTVADAFVGAGDAGVGCGELGVERTFRACATVKSGNGVNGCFGTPAVVSVATPPTMTYDSNPPAAPTVTELVAVDRALIAKVTIPTDADSFVLEYKEASAGDDAYVESGTFSSSAASGKVADLTNGIEYSVRARAADAANNKSDPSPALNGTPVLTLGVIDYYNQNGGDEHGGCAMAGAGDGSGSTWFLIAVVSAAGMIFVRRRR